MNIAIHYNADHPGLAVNYLAYVYERVFSAFLNHRRINIDSEIRVGHVPFYRMKEPALKL